MKTFEWNGSEEPVGKSFDLFGDGTPECIESIATHDTEVEPHVIEL